MNTGVKIISSQVVKARDGIGRNGLARFIQWLRLQHKSIKYMGKKSMHRNDKCHEPRNYQHLIQCR